MPSGSEFGRVDINPTEGHYVSGVLDFLTGHWFAAK
jgi:hypothetical protein